ncbi:MAG: PEP-CTERM sorting domain-containing protein [Colwellia sp.]|nr:PEP-CTERM sorting domain-containing protein [Colwellia sp.]
MHHRLQNRLIILIVNLFISFNVNSQLLLLVDFDNGTLLGANHVAVDNAIFNVRFSNVININGKQLPSSNTSFTQFDQISPNGGFFDPGNLADANRFSTALFDQVFIDLPMDSPNRPNDFDSNPRLTNGCPTTVCGVNTPFDFDLFTVFSGLARNIGGPTGGNGGPDQIDGHNWLLSQQFPPDHVWAIWTIEDLNPVLPLPQNPVPAIMLIRAADFDLFDIKPPAAVPEPSSLFLFFISLLGIGGRMLFKSLNRQ